MVCVCRMEKKKIFLCPKKEEYIIIKKIIPNFLLQLKIINNLMANNNNNLKMCFYLFLLRIVLSGMVDFFWCGGVGHQSALGHRN